MVLLAKRIQGLSPTEAAQILEKDRAAMEEWLAALGEKADPLHFAQGFLLITSPDELVALIKEEAEKPPKPQLCLHMELPPGSKLRRVEGVGESGKLVTRKGLWLAIEALPEEAVESLADASSSGAGPIERSVLTVTFGPVTGRKFIIKAVCWRGPFKIVEYALAVPGGHVSASISAVGKNTDELNWDEGPFEASFHTISIVTKPPPPTPDHLSASTTTG